MLQSKKLKQNDHGQSIGYAVDAWVPSELPRKEKMLGQYCVLEPLDLNKHTNDLYEALAEDQDWTYLPFGPFKTREEFSVWLGIVSTQKHYFTIIDHTSNRPQGLASYHDIDLQHGVIEVGSMIYSRALQKTRVATEAMYLMMKHVFDDLKYRRYQWRCNSLNQRSRKAAERLGFRFEGIFRNALVVKGHNRDTAWYSIIDAEWPVLKLKFEKWLQASNFDKNEQQITRLQDL